MPWTNPTDQFRAGPSRAIDLTDAFAAIDAGNTGVKDTAVRSTERIHAMQEQQVDAGAGWDEAEFGYNEKTGQIMLPNNKLLDASPPVMMQLATVKNDDGTALPKIKNFPQGFRPMSQAELQRTIDAIPTESDFWGEAVAAGKQTLGLAATAIDAMFGNDVPEMGWNNAQADLRNRQSIGEIKAGEGRWYSSWDSFLSNLGTTAGNITGTVAAAIPVAAGGALAGLETGPGSVIAGVGAGLTTLTGGTAAFGEQATEFYGQALEQMQSMGAEKLKQQSPLFRQVLAENPGISDEEAMKTVAIEGARTAGTVAGMLGAAETIVGAKLAGNFLGRLGFSKAIGAQVAKKAGLPWAVARTAGRGTLGALGAGAEEIAETTLGQAAGAATTGVGSADPRDYINVDEGIAAAQGGLLFGAFGGRGHSDAAANVIASDIGAALRESSDVNQPWNQSPQMTPAQETPAYQRFPEGLPRTPAAPPQAMDSQQRQQVMVQIGNVLAERFGPEWATNIDEISQDPQGRQLVGQLMGFAREIEQEASMNQQGVQQRVDDRFAQQVYAGQPEPVGAQAPPVPAAPTTIPDRRAAQDAQLQAADVASQQAPAALPPPGPTEAQDANLQQIDADLDGLETLMEQRFGEDWATNPLVRQSETGQQLMAEYARLMGAWEELQQQRLVPTTSQTPQAPAQVESGEPLAASTQRTPDGRPMGVTPAPLVNPMEMSPEEAASRAQAQSERSGEMVTPEQVAAAAAATEEGVMPSTPEPAADIAVQVEAMLDPATDRDAVFVAEGNESAVPADLPEDVMVVTRPGIGTLLTTDPNKASKFKRNRNLTDADVAEMLGMSETKGQAVRRGRGRLEVVQARTPRGVAAEQVSSPQGVPAAARSVARQAPRGSRIVRTTPEAAQQERAARIGPKTRAAKERVEARREPRPPKRRRAKDDDEREGTLSLVDLNDQTVGQRAAAEATETPRAKAPATEAAPRRSTAATVETAASRRERTVNVAGKAKTLPTRLTRQTGQRGSVVDLSVEAIDEQGYADAQALLQQTLTADDMSAAEALVRDYDQLATMLDASVAAAEERLAERIKAAPAGEAHLREAERRQLEKEQTASRGQRGRPRGRPKTSPLAHMPLLAEEARDFLTQLRDQAKAEVRDGTSAAQSVARRMLVDMMPRQADALSGERSNRIVEAVAKLTDRDLDGLLPSTYEQIKDSQVAKQVVRGATEVAHATHRENQDLANQREIPDVWDHDIPGLTTKTLPNAITYSDTPDNVGKLVNDWVGMMEKAGTKLAAPIRVMSLQSAMKTFPRAFASGRVPNGKTIINSVKGKVNEYIIAVDWDKFSNEAVALEILAHEFGHVVSTEVYARSDLRTRAAIDKAFDTWIRSTRGLSVLDVLKSRSPGVIRSLLRATPETESEAARKYATEFREWAADHVARYMLTDAKPVGLVEKYFARVAEVLKKVYAAITGSSKPDQQWQEALDRWIAGTATVTPMPTGLFSASYEHNGIFDAGAEDTTGLKAGHAAADRTTAALQDVKDLFGGFADGAKRDGVKGVTEAAADVANSVLQRRGGVTARRFGLSLTTLRQIERKYRNTPLGAPLTAWTRLMQQKAQIANVEREAGSLAVEHANQLDAKVRTALEQVMYYATHFGVNPEVSFKHTSNDHLQSADPRVQAVNHKRYNHVRDLYEAAVAADPRVAAVYTELRDAFTDLHHRTLDAKIELIRSSQISERVQEEMVDRIKAANADLKNGPYFPMMRFGDWITKVLLPSKAVGPGGDENATFTSKTKAREEMRHQRALNPGATVKIEEAEKGEYRVRIYQRGVYFHASEAEARAARADIEREVREQYDAVGVDLEDVQSAVEDTLSDDPDELVISNPFNTRDDYNQTKLAGSEFMAEVRQLVNEGKIDGDVANSLERLALEALPEFSYRKSLLPRQNIFGASKQMLRAYANRYQGAAHHYATVVKGQAINKAWENAWKVARNYAPAGAVLNTLKANQDAIRERTSGSLSNRIQNVITDASSMFSLAFSPAYVLTNAMQPGMITIPVLAGYNDRNGNTIGVVKAGKYLQDAYKGALPFFTQRGFKDFIDDSKRLIGKRSDNQTLQESAKNILDTFGKTDEERAMLQALLEQGTLDFSWLNSLEDAMRSGGKVGEKWAALQRAGMAFPQQVEAMNRVTTALAAYRMAKAEGIHTDEALLQQFADDVVADTQLDYSRLNRPLAFNKTGLNIILQFKLYLQGMYALFARNAAMALKGATPEERRQGRRTIMYLLGSHAAIGGVTGLGPVASMAKLGMVAFAAMAGDDDDKFKSGNQLMKEFLKDHFGEEASLVAEKGLPALLGVDMSERIGIPMLVDSRFAQVKDTDTAAQGLDKWVLYSLGAPYSNGRRILQGLSDVKNGDMRNAAKALPAGIRALVRSGQWATEGLVDQSGDTFIPKDELDFRDLAITGLGLSTTKTAEAYTERSELKSTTARIVAERKALLKQYRTGDREEAREAIAEFNRSVPKPFRITSDALAESVSAHKDKEAGKRRKDEAAVARMLDQ
jgi:hypothetical protein